MSEKEKENKTPTEYVSKVLLAWELPENNGKIEFPKKSCLCRRCPHSDWQILEQDFVDEDDEQGKEPQTILECVNYCHDRYTQNYAKGMPNVLACDGFHKPPKQ